MDQPDQPLIVGAGPVGLGAALFLARQGRVPRVVEMRDAASRESKALAVNPRTLDILEPTGVTERMLKLGMPIYGGQFHRGKKVVANLSFAGIHPRYPFLLALSQASTERLLAQALEQAGGAVERGVKLVQCRNLPDRVEAALETTGDSRQTTVHVPWLLAADGAHSMARDQLGIEFAGSSFAQEWFLADVPLRTTLSQDRAHIFFLEGGGFLFVLRVVDEALNTGQKEPIWRVVGNLPQPLAHLVQAEPAGPPVWTSSFKISHRINATLAGGRVYFAGDAAHIHSPIGARGMNLGLEDAWVFAELVRTGRLAEYNQLRRPVDLGVVRRVKLLSQVAAAESPQLRFARRFIFPMATKIPFVRAQMFATLAGLDHELPRL